MSTALPPAAIQPDTLTLDELAQRMKISYSTAYELAVRDRLPVPVIKAGRQYRFSRRAYDAVMDARHESTTDRQQSA